MKVFYEETKSKKRINSIMAIVLLGSCLLILGIFWVYKINNQNIPNKYRSVEAKKLSGWETSQEENNESNKRNENIQDITETINNATKFVVGISKLKDNGSSVFTNNGVGQMGIGSGIIVSENGYILTNEHVSGSKWRDLLYNIRGWKAIPSKSCMVRL